MSRGEHTVFEQDTAQPAPYRGLGSEFIRWICIAYLKLSGWTLRGDWPDLPKAVLLAAPHTSNWDGLNMLATAGYYRVKLTWMGKESLSDSVFGPLLIRMGLLPVNRSGGLDLVDAAARAIAESEAMILAVAPEGTRSTATKWKSGYYHIARRGGVPIIFSVLDYGTKTVRISGMMEPTGDYDADRTLIRNHYRNATGKHPDKFELDA